MDTAEQDVLEFLTLTDRETVTEAPPKKRQRKKRESAEPSPPEEVIATVEPPKKAPRRRTRSLTLSGKDVAAAVSMGSQLIVLGTGHPHWYIPENEVLPWADSAAQLLNRIPTRYVNAFSNVSSVAVVVFGVYRTIYPRIEQERILRAQEREQSEQNTENGRVVFTPVA